MWDKEIYLNNFLMNECINNWWIKLFIYLFILVYVYIEYLLGVVLVGYFISKVDMVFLYNSSNSRSFNY